MDNKNLRKLQKKKCICGKTIKGYKKPSINWRTWMCRDSIIHTSVNILVTMEELGFIHHLVDV